MAKEKCFGAVPLLRAEGGEEESQFGLTVPEDSRTTEAETMILPRTPDEALVVDVCRSCREKQTLLVGFMRETLFIVAGGETFITKLGEGRKR